MTSPRRSEVPLITDAAGLQAFIDVIDRSAPVAIDAERAHSFRYSTKAYLLQFHQSACGTHLLDPIAISGRESLAHLDDLSAALSGCEWVLHAASQDLPCLAEVGLMPRRIFDTELAGRLLGLDKVSLSPMLARYLGIELAKEHSAADWSRRPLPPAWLAYASLDVDYLLELRDAVAADLAEAGKTVWADQEFADVIERFALVPQEDCERWRHTKGVSRLRQPRQLAVARALWQTRDALARDTDIAPTRILPDTALVAAAAALAPLAPAQVAEQLTTLTGFTGPFVRRRRRRWIEAVNGALASDPRTWPARQGNSGGTPPPRIWSHLNPQAAARWEVARPAVLALAGEHNLPPENLLTVSDLAFVIWPDAADFSVDGLREALTHAHARPWQRDLLAPALAEALAKVKTVAPTS